jgi:hypothetical protein
MSGVSKRSAPASTSKRAVGSARKAADKPVNQPAEILLAHFRRVADGYLLCQYEAVERRGVLHSYAGDLTGVDVARMIAGTEIRADLVLRMVLDLTLHAVMSIDSIQESIIIRTATRSLLQPNQNHPDGH